MPNTTTNKNHKKRSYTFPSPFVIIAALMLLTIIVSWICYAAGVSFTDVGGVERKITGLGILDIFPAIWHGFIERADIILFVLALGGLLAIMDHSKILDAGIDRLTQKMKGKEIILIPILMLLFGLAGSTFGFWEETLAFFPILIPIFIKARYDAMTGIMVILLGAGAGCLASTINPFSVGVGYSAANTVDTVAGLGVKSSDHLMWRAILWIIFEIPTIAFVMWYALRVRKNHNLSTLTTENNNRIKNKFIHAETGQIPEFKLRQKISLAFFILIFITLIVAYLPWDSMIPGIADPRPAGAPASWWDTNMFWFASVGDNGNVWGLWGGWTFISISAIFLIGTIIIGVINRQDFTKSTTEGKDIHFLSVYLNGAKDMLPVSMLIAAAFGLGYLLTVSQIGTWIASSVQGLGQVGLIGFGVIIFILSLALSLLIPSSSGFAGAFIPIFAGVAFTSFAGDPVLQKAAVEVVIIAFMLANGLANFFTPTSAALMAYTSFALVTYGTWMKAVWKYVIVAFVVCLLLVIISAAVLPNIGF